MLSAAVAAVVTVLAVAVMLAAALAVKTGGVRVPCRGDDAPEGVRVPCRGTMG